MLKKIDVFGESIPEFNTILGAFAKLREVTICFVMFVFLSVSVRKGKAVTLQAWSGPEGFMKLRFPDFTKTAQDGGKVISLTHRPHLPPGNDLSTHFS